MRKSLIGLVLMGIMFTITIPVVYANSSRINNIGINISITEYNKLLNLGFTEDYIDTMEQEEFDYNKSIIGHVVSETTKFYRTTIIYGYAQSRDSLSQLNVNNNLFNTQYDRISLQTAISDGILVVQDVIDEEITESEFNEMEDEGIVTVITRNATNVYETSGKKLTTTITYQTSSKRYRMQNVLAWKTMPSVRSHDLFGIKVNNAAVEPVSNSHWGRTTYTMKESCTNTSTNYTGALYPTGQWKRSPQGYGVTFELPKNSTGSKTWNVMTGTYPCVWTGAPLPPPKVSPVNYNITLTAMTHTMYFDVVKVGVTSPISAYGSFQHAVNTVSLSTSLSFTIGATPNLGIVFTVSNTKNYDGMGGTHAQILKPVW